jgi:hypothetical protein
MQRRAEIAGAKKMARRLEPSDLGKRKYWGAAGSVGFLIEIVAMHFMKSSVLLTGGIVIGLLGGVLVAAIRGLGEL